MIGIFGNIICPKCNLETRCLLEIESDKDEFLLLGDKIKSNIHNDDLLSKEVFCDLCQHEFIASAVIINQTISGFLNDKEAEKFKLGDITIEEAKEKVGIRMEKTKNLKQFHTTMTIKFKKQPFVKEQIVTIEDENWIVESIYKKESIEKDLTIRMLDPFHDQYWYEIVNVSNNERRWLVVTDTKENNAVVMQETPALKQNEIIHDISDSTFKDELFYEEEISEYYKIKSYKTVSGIRVFLLNDENEVEIDAYGNDLDEAMALIKEELTNQTD